MLGLLEVNQIQGMESYRIRRILTNLLHDVDESSGLLERAAHVLYKAGGLRDEMKSDELYLETYPLGKLAEAKNFVPIRAPPSPFPGGTEGAT